MARQLGDTLRERRERLGYSLETAAEATNIRARMLAEIEAGNYGSLPAQGHAGGMVSSYAKFLGLDPSGATLRFQTEYRAYLSTKGEMPAASTRRVRSTARANVRTSSTATGRLSRRSARESSYSSALQQEQVARNDDRYKSGTVKIVGSRPGTTGNVGSRRRCATQLDDPFAPRTSKAVDDGAGSSLQRTKRGTRTRTRTRAAAEPRSRDDAPGNERIVQHIIGLMKGIFAETRTRLIAIAVILLVIAVAITVNILMSTAGDPNSGVIYVEGGAVDTTETNTDSSKASATITTTNGTPVSVKIEVADGQTSLVNVTYDDDNAYNGMAVGSWVREFQVTESMSATFGNPDAVTVTENGTVVEIERQEDGTGKLTLQIKSTSTVDDE